ncbi:MAG TPA: sigma-70 family RNA polymerase sigma factor [Kofleriaceae bacterium]|nr:sigma-70 family RNA polymerase sigma factor [Kofleriaceae bacterium]
MALAPRDPADRAPPRGELDDVTLARAQRGDAAAWRALVQHHQSAVFALLGRMLGGGRRATVEDLAQETFLAVFRQLPSFQTAGPARLSTWILTIASRRAIDELRRRPASPILVDDIAPSAASTGDRADDAIDRRRIATAIDRALADLSPEHRAAFVLRELHGLDYADIARALEIDLGTVKSRLSRARDALRRALAEVHP